MWKSFSAHSKETSEVSPRSFGSILLAKLQEPNRQASPETHNSTLAPTQLKKAHSRNSLLVQWFGLCSHCQGRGFNTWSELKSHKPCNAAKKKKQAHAHAVWSQPAHSTPAVEHQALGLSSLRLSPSSVTLLLCVLGQVTSLLWVSEATFENRATEDTDFIEVLWTLGKVGHWGGKRTWH